MEDEAAPQSPAAEQPPPPKFARGVLLTLVVVLCAGTLLPIGLLTLFGATELGHKISGIHGMEFFTEPFVMFGLSWTAVLLAAFVAYSARSTRLFWLVWVVLLGVALLNTNGCVSIWNEAPKHMRF